MYVHVAQDKSGTVGRKWKDRGVELRVEGDSATLSAHSPRPAAPDSVCCTGGLAGRGRASEEQDAENRHLCAAAGGACG
jgi:hypothetical protein